MHMPQKDPEARRAYMLEYKRRYRKTDSGRAAIADSDRARHANQRAAQAGMTGQITTADARAVMAFGRCFYCGGTDKLGIDHVIPLARGGPNEIANLVCCCLSCNISKRNGDRPRRWAWDHDQCVSCGTSERPHRARGHCGACYQREFGWSREKHAAYERERRQRARTGATND